MKDLIIIGAGDFAREAVWVAERMNQQRLQWNILGFVDDDESKTGMMLDGYPILSNVKQLTDFKDEIYVTCAIGNGRVRKDIWNCLKENEHIKMATLIDPSVIVGKATIIGKGSILCAGTILAISSRLGINSIVNLNCTIGHDSILEDFCTVHPGTNISGRVKIGCCTDIGTGSKIIQGLSIEPQTILGAGAVVVNDIEESGTYVGVPARKIK